jgi:hypothetical protein
VQLTERRSAQPLPRSIASQAVAQLDLQASHACYGGTGSEAYPSGLLLRIVLYEIHLGEHSPAPGHPHKEGFLSCTLDTRLNRSPLDGDFSPVYP